VLINAGNQFELGGANSAFSRIPLGIANLLSGETPPSGISVTRFFIIFDTLVILALAVQLWSLVRVSRGPVARLGANMATLWALLPLTWEIGVALLLLAGYPALLGFSWPVVFAFVPDLSAVILAVSLLWLATGLVRTGRLVASRVHVKSTSETEAGLTRYGWR
jgi:hypothetical protein